MMVVLPLRWQGRRRSEELRLLLADRCGEWHQAWAVSNAPSCDLELPGQEASALARAGESWLEARTAHGTLYLRIANGAQQALGAQLLRLDASGSAGLAESIGRRAFADLARVLASTESTPPRVEALDARPAGLAARNGTLQLAWVLGTARADLFAEASLCEALLPPVRQPAPALTSRHDAIQSESITLDAVLDLGTAGLQDVLALRPGEVIKTRLRLDAPLHARLPDGRAAFSGALLAEQDQRALRCTDIPRRETR
jgi:hypothetical protein